ncbi:hypothetical protein RRG08_016117 [Elysia crispata]|uniref:Uncharacterized protein n=1 Tax=Elysia crispata TaxID=231223 RepID=A0AAE0ZPP3_9GAST|nr:hypothetical protein RRG08_016117 [Elysia crispata]
MTGTLLWQTSRAAESTDRDKNPGELTLRAYRTNSSAEWAARKSGTVASWCESWPLSVSLSYLGNEHREKTGSDRLRLTVLPLIGRANRLNIVGARPGRNSETERRSCRCGGSCNCGLYSGVERTPCWQDLEWKPQCHKSNLPPSY